MMIGDLGAEGPEWRERAACLRHPAVLFFGMDDAEAPGDRREREEQAKLICRECIVRLDCLGHALEAREPYGIWGGLNEVERKARLRAMAKASR